MSLRCGGYLAAVVFLAACGQGLSAYHPSTLPATVSEHAYLPAKPAPKPTPAYGLATQLPDRVIHPDELSASVGSLKATTYIKKKRYVDIVDAPPACYLDGTKTVSGCSVIFDGSTELDIKRATYDMYTKPKAKGCILAEATFKGDVAYDSTVASTFKPVNTTTCWK
jgi:hypothetical protein